METSGQVERKDAPGMDKSQIRDLADALPPEILVLLASESHGLLETQVARGILAIYPARFEPQVSLVLSDPDLLEEFRLTIYGRMCGVRGYFGNASWSNPVRVGRGKNVWKYDPEKSPFRHSTPLPKASDVFAASRID
jgi:hypothetical protein